MMFEAELAEKLQRIFKLKKVTYSSPGDPGNPPVSEQETLFIEVESSRNVIRDGLAQAKVTGKATLNGKSDKVPFGFFSKSIQQAAAADTKDLFFFDIENNSRVFQDIVQRSFSFIYFFSGQYDPEIGTLTSVEIEIEET